MVEITMAATPPPSYTTAEHSDHGGAIGRTALSRKIGKLSLITYDPESEAWT